MRILALDTALGACSAAVISGNEVLAREHEMMPRGHAEALAPMVQRVMRDAKMAFSALDRVGVTTGPGTFTGQRVGIAFARALGVALKIPVVGVTTLHAIAAEALSVFPEGRWAVVVADAKRGEAYLAAYSQAGEIVVHPRLAHMSEIANAVADGRRMLGHRPLLAGTGAPAAMELLVAAGFSATDAGHRQPDAVFVARITAQSPATQSPRPLYLRAPDARLPQT